MPLRIACLVLFFIASWAEAADSAPPIAELRGPVVIAGSGDVSQDTRDMFFNLAGKAKAQIVVVAVGKLAEPKLKPWQDLKPATLIAVDAKEMKRDEFAKALDEASGIWFDDGSVKALAECICNPNFEKHLKAVQARGGVVGGSGAAAALFADRIIDSDGKMAAGLGLLPGFLIRHGGKATFESAVDRNPAYVGLSLEPGAAIVIRDRTLRVIGEKSISFRIAAGGGKPVAEQEAKAGSIFDLYQLRRAATNRASKEPFPPMRPKDPVVEKGTLVIVGGGGTTPEIMNTFFAKAGGKDKVIVVIPTTEADGPGDAGYLRKFGATNVKVLFTLDRKLADDPKFSEDLLNAGGVWFGGGRQWRFVDSFEGTLVEKRCHEVLARGGVIGGSSAGASIQGEYMPRGHPLGNTVMAAEGYERGFGFLPACAVDQHFFARKRTADMTGLMKKYPQYLGIGIDEATAIVVSGSNAEVMGRSKVAFYDTGKKPTVAYEWDDRGRLVWFDQDYEELKPGERYDLKTRERIR